MSAPVCLRASLLTAGVAAALWGQNTLTANPQQVNLAATVNSTTPASQTVSVLTSGREIPYTAVIRYLGGMEGWLTVNPPAGTAPATLTLSASPANLTPGTYAAQVAINEGTSGTFVQVSFRVLSQTGGGIVADRSGLTFVNAAAASAPQQQTFSVSAAKGASGPVQFRAAANSAGNWLVVTPSSATTPATLTVLALPTALRGVLHGNITLTPATGSPIVIPVAYLPSEVTQVPVTMSLSQTAITVNHQLGTADPPLQTVFVNSTGAILQYTASTTTSWLRLQTPSSPTPVFSVTDQTPGQLGIVILPHDLTPGTYVGVVVATAAGVPPIELPVSLTVTTTPALNADPSSLALDDLVTELPVLVTSTDASTLTFTATVPPSSPWLQVTPVSSSTLDGFAVISISANRTGLLPGVYTSVVTLTVAGSGASLRIPVRLTVTAPQQVGVLGVSAESLELTTVVGGPSPSRSVLVTSTGTTPHTFTATALSNAGWLMVEPFFGTAPANLTIRADPEAVSPGTHEGLITITSLLTGAQQDIAVRFTVVEQALAADPSTLEFVQERKGQTPAAKVVQITASAPTPFVIANSTKWIAVSPDRGLTPLALSISVDPTGLPPGTSRGEIQVTAGNAKLTIPVVVRTPELPRPVATPETITFTHELGSPAPRAQSLAVASTGEAVRFTVAAKTESGANWLTVTPSSGATPATVTAAINTAQVVPGKHSGTITVASADGTTPPQSIAVNLTVSASSVSVQGLLHGATLEPTAIAPGQVMVLKGAGLGPATGVVAQPTAAGAYETRLADVRLLFDGVPAPLLFVRNDQINAIVPYAMHGRLSARVQVESGTSFSIPIEAKVVDAAPGLFTLNSSGAGQAAALNSDFTINSATNPAARGSVITVFGTGEGQTDPAGQDGRVILTDLRRPRLAVLARIGGLPAEVLYFGSAPTLVSGVFQANLRIPEAVEPGAVPVEVQVSGEVSQRRVTIALR